MKTLNEEHLHNVFWRVNDIYRKVLELNQKRLRIIQTSFEMSMIDVGKLWEIIDTGKLELQQNSIDKRS